VGETRVDLQHLLEDLRDAYTGALEETILTEVIANGDSELGRLVDSTVWINDAHPAFTRAISSRSLGYHTAHAVALALAPLAVEARDEHTFITQFLAYWGSSHASTGTTDRRRGK
jgi:hypothetical protein